MIKKSKRSYTNLVLVMIVLLSSVFSDFNSVKAATYQPVNLGTIAGTGATVKQGNNTAYWYDGIGKISVDGEIGFCIEPTTLGLGGSYSKEEMVDWQLQYKLGYIVYYGWDTTNKTDDDYAVTQYMIWEALGASITEWHGDFGSRYNDLKAAVQAKINRHDLGPSFEDKNYEVNLGDTLTIPDQNKVLNEFHVNSNAGANVSISGNNLVITPSVDTLDNIVITLDKVLSTCVGAPIAYRSSADDGQDVGVFRVIDPFTVKVNIKVNKFGKMNITKQDEDGAYIPGTSFSLSYHKDMSDPIGTYTTGTDGTILVEQLLPKKVYIQEVAVPEPLIIDTDIKEITIKPNETVNFNAKNIYKTGNLEIQKLDKDTGKLITLSPTEFSIYETDTDAFVKTITTVDGVASLTGIRWGNYYYIESKAAQNYTISSEKVPFQIRDNGVTLKKSLSNKRTLGTIELSKIDAETGKTAQGDATLEGAVYLLKAKENIISPDDGHIVHKKGDIVTKMVIKDSAAKVENLYLGKYEVVEETPSEGYLLDKTAYDVTLNYTDQNKTVEIQDVTSSEQVKKRAFELIKISSDGESGTTPTLKGAHFVVKLESEVQKVGWDKAKTYDELVTDSSGYAKSIELPYGKSYRVRETVVPENHTKVPDFFVSVLEDSREPMKWTVQNDAPYKTYIGIAKTDSETGDIVRLAGATFKIKNLDTGDYVGFWVYGDLLGKYVTEFTTNDDGNIMTPGAVRAGHYQLEEIKAPNGMLLAKESKPFTISDDGAHQIGPDGTSYITTIQFSDAPAKGQLILEKTADLFLGYEPVETEYGTLFQAKFEEGLLKGVTYEIRAREDVLSADGTRVYYQKGQLVEKLKTDGISATKSSLLPLGAYTLQEVACDDEGYVIDSNVYEFDLKYKDQLTEVVYQTMKPYNDKKRAAATIEKTFEDSEVINNDDIYQKVTFGVFTADDLKVNNKNVLEPDSMVQIVSLDKASKGEITADFAGDYYLQELSTDDQYVLSTEKYPFNFEYTGDEKTLIEINNGQPIKNLVKRGDIKVLKVDTDTGNPLAGTVFEISRDEDFKTILATAESGSDGYAIFKNIEKSKIYLREKLARDGYTINKEVKEVQIETDGQIIELKYDNKAYRGNIHVYKIDKETKENLSGIRYKVTAAEDIYEIGHPIDDNGEKIIKYHKGDPVSVDISVDGYYMTDELGSFHLSDLPLGTYEITEVQSLDGYVLDPLTHVVSITPENDVDAVIEKTLYVDNDYTKVDINKVDIDTKEHIKGAKLELINDKTGEIVKAWMSTGKSMHFDRLPVADYTLKETSPADGYVTADDLHFSVKPRTDLQTFTMVDDYIKVDISKTDMETEKPLSGANLILYRISEDGKKEKIDEWTSTEKTHRINYASQGTYLLHEESSPLGYRKAADIEFEVKETGAVQQINMKDEKIYTYIKVKKVASNDHAKVLSGAEFTLFSDEACTDEIGKAVGNKDGISLFDHIPYSTVYLKETKAPEGYNISADVVKVVIDDEWYYENEDKTIVIADHVIETVKTGLPDNSYLTILFLGSLGMLTYLSYKKRKAAK